MRKFSIDFPFMIYQTDPRWPEYLGIKRWGCYYKACLAIPQILTKRSFSIQEHRKFFDMLMNKKLLTIDSIENSVIRPYISDTGKLITYILAHVSWKGEAVHIGNTTEYLYYATPHRTDFTLVRRKSVERKEDGTLIIKGHHFVLGNENGIPIWDPHPGLNLEDDPYFIRIRIDGKELT